MPFILVGPVSSRGLDLAPWVTEDGFFKIPFSNMLIFNNERREKKAKWKTKKQTRVKVENSIS